MTPERWRQVTSLFHAARAKAPDAREPFLREASRDDPSLVDDVLAMLRAEETASTLTRGPGVAESPVLANGATIGPYRVEARIGSGGMGEVYRAIDTRLHRTVALKALAPDLGRDTQFQARFEREARLLASLNHPHIGAIYGLETSGDLSVLVLELVEGPTLAERLKTGRLRLTETLRNARQIASALEAAHDKGIVHRDLKPANVKIAPDGSIKVLDFGIAKMIAGDAAATMTADRTATGSVFGTPAYMSPEQLRGGAVDKRADIWAFGCVLYEMLTGRHAFAGDTVPDIVARIVERQPDWEALPADVPPSIRALLRHCLQKDPADRLHDIADARIELADALTQPDATTPATIGARRGRHSRWAMVLVLVSVAAAVIWFGSTRLNAPTTPNESIEFGLRFPPEFRPGGGMAVSPDGRYVATRLFGTTAQIWLTSLDSSETRPLAGTEGASFPFWSADGSQVGFFRGGRMRRVARTGGPVTDICDAPAIAASWNSDDAILFTSGPSLLQVPASGGTPKIVRTAEGPDVVSLANPQFLPDNRHFLFHAGRADGQGVWRVGSIDSDQTVDVMESAWPLIFTKPNHVLFVHGASLVARSLDLQTYQLVGAEKTLVSNIVPGTLALTPLFSASATTLAFRTPFAGEPGQLTWFTDGGVRQESIPSPAQGEYLNPRISPDAGRVAVNAMDPTGNWDIWIWNRARGFSSRLTTDPAVDSDPVWSPDGTTILFTSNRGGHQGFYRRSANGSGADEELARVDGSGLIENVGARAGTLVLGDWSRDGRHVVYTTVSGSPLTIWAMLLGDTPAPVRISDGTTLSYAPRLSPDGKWLAYTDGSTGMLEVHVRRFLAAGAQAQISHGGGIHPRWIANGRGLTFVKIGGGIAAVDLEFDESGIRVDPERILTPLPVLTLNDNRSHYDVTEDGRHLLVRQPAGSPSPPVTVVVNWTARLK